MELFARAEAERLAAKERLRRRQMRIIQVREQTLNWMSKSRERFEEAKTRQVKKLVEELTTEVEEEILQQIEEMTEAHDIALGEIGRAHRAARNTHNPNDTESLKKVKRLKGESLAKDRYKAALQKERESKTIQKENFNKLQQIRDKIREDAKIHAQKITERIPFKPLDVNASEDGRYFGRSPSKRKEKGPPLFQQSIANSLHIPAEVRPIAKKQSKKRIKVQDRSPPRGTRSRTFSPKKNRANPVIAKDLRPETAPPSKTRTKTPTSKTQTHPKVGVFAKVADERNVKKKDKSNLTTTIPVQGTEGNSPRPAVITKFVRAHAPTARKARTPVVDYYDASIPSRPVKYIPPAGLAQSVAADPKIPSAWQNAETLNREKQKVELKKALENLENKKKATVRGKNAMQIAKLDKKMKQLSSALIDQEHLERYGQGRPMPPGHSQHSLVGLDEISPPQSIVASSSSSEFDFGDVVPPPTENIFQPYEFSKVSQMVDENVSWIDKQLKEIRKNQIASVTLSVQERLDNFLATAMDVEDLNLGISTPPQDLGSQIRTQYALDTNQALKSVKPSSAQTDLRNKKKSKIPEQISEETENSSSDIPSHRPPNFGSDVTDFESPPTTSLSNYASTYKPPSPPARTNAEVEKTKVKSVMTANPLGSALAKELVANLDVVDRLMLSKMESEYKRRSQLESRQFPPLELPQPLGEAEMNDLLGTLNFVPTSDPNFLLPAKPKLKTPEVKWFTYDPDKENQAQNQNRTNLDVNTQADTYRQIISRHTTIYPPAANGVGPETDTLQTWSSASGPDFPRTRLDSVGSSISSLEKTDAFGTYLESPGYLTPSPNKTATFSSSKGPLTSTPGSSKKRAPGTETDSSKVFRTSLRVVPASAPVPPAVKLLASYQIPPMVHRTSIVTQTSRPRPTHKFNTTATSTLNNFGVPSSDGPEDQNTLQNSYKPNSRTPHQHHHRHSKPTTPIGTTTVAAAPPIKVKNISKEAGAGKTMITSKLSPASGSSSAAKSHSPNYVKECVDKPRYAIVCRDLDSDDNLPGGQESLTTPRTSRVLKHYMKRLLNMRPDSVEALSSGTSASSSTSVIQISSSAAVSISAGKSSSEMSSLSNDKLQHLEPVPANVNAGLRNHGRDENHVLDRNGKNAKLSSIDETSEEMDGEMSTSFTKASDKSGTTTSATSSTSGTKAQVTVNIDHDNDTSAASSKSAKSLTRILTNMCIDHCLDDQAQGLGLPSNSQGTQFGYLSVNGAGATFSDTIDSNPHTTSADLDSSTSHANLSSGSVSVTMDELAQHWSKIVIAKPPWLPK